MRLFAGFLFAYATVDAALLAVFLWLSSGDRRDWVIRGPAPFDSWGSGPYILWSIVGLVLSALLLVVGGMLALRRRRRPAIACAALATVPLVFFFA